MENVSLFLLFYFLLMTGLLISFFLLLSSMYFFPFVDILTLTNFSFWMSLLFLLIELLI